MALYSRLLLKCTTPVHIYSRRWASTVKNIDKVLIANRGEIACRIIRTARRLGIKTVAVYSDIDEQALHVQMADEAYNIGHASAEGSYLRGDRIIEVAVQSKCQALHPGYGFLSENVDFAESCATKGIIFIGPSPDAIRKMGIKSTSKELMISAGVPVIQGYQGEDQSSDKLFDEAKKIGYPVIIKAVHGGGGKGMRIARKQETFMDQLDSAKREAKKSFASSAVLLEKYVEHSRHVEVQIFGDVHGNIVHLFERDCSIQRRHQKIIEESPAPNLPDSVRKELGVTAVKAGHAVKYRGAGTIEFILDRESFKYYFLEVNTRLQVEHPITEMVTGTDLVEWQFKVASGEPLPLTQEQIKLSGHSFEARIYAEDPSSGFLPGAGPLLYLSPPQAKSDVRIESGVVQGDEVSVHYDPMIAKLIVWGNNRSEALSKLRSNLVEFSVAGVQTNINFLLDLTKHQDFVNGIVHTRFIKDHIKDLFEEKKPSEEILIQAGLALTLYDEINDLKTAVHLNDHFNPFIIESCFRVNHLLERTFKLTLFDQVHDVKVKFYKPQEYQVSVDGSKWKYVTGNLTRDDTGLILYANIDNVIENSTKIFVNDEYLCIFDKSGKTEFALDQPKYLEDAEAAIGATNYGYAASPMPGVLEKVLVKKGDKVKQNDPLFVVIAMKMEHVVHASLSGTVTEIYYRVGNNIPKGATVVKIVKETV